MTVAALVRAARARIENLTGPYHLPALTPDRRVSVQCRSGARSALAAATLADLGYTRVAHLDGGILAWAAAGRPMTR